VRRIHLLLACVVLTGPLLAGCSDDAPGTKDGNAIEALAADQVLRQATEAARSASSVHLKGQVRDRDQVALLDLRLKGNQGATGTVTLGQRRFDITRIGEDLYVNGGKGAFDALGPAAPLLEGRPVLLPADDARFAELAAFTDLRTMMDNLLGIRGEIRKGETSTINGLPALALVDASDDGLLWVAAAGKPYPLRLHAPKPSSARGTAGTVDFLEYDRPVELKAPANAVRLGG
jgi:outer membrane murein-binding lipoprotein Lpp